MLGTSKMKYPIKKQPRAKSVNATENRRVNVQHVTQVQLGIAHVDAVDVSDNVAEKEQWQQPPGDFGDRRALLDFAQINGAAGWWNDSADRFFHGLEGGSSNRNPEAMENETFGQKLSNWRQSMPSIDRRF